MSSPIMRATSGSPPSVDNSVTTRPSFFGSSAETVGDSGGLYRATYVVAGCTGVGGWLVAPHQTARPSVARPRGSPSSPAPAAHRSAASGLDRDARGRAVGIGAVVAQSVRRCCRVSSISAAGLSVDQKAKQLAAGRVEATLLGFGLAMRQQRPAVVADEVEDDLLDWPPAEGAVHLQLADDLTAKSPNVVAVLPQGLA